MNKFWDLRYAGEDFAYGTEPNNFFREMIDSLPPGRILLPGEGEGRNAVYAARNDWQVTAFDQSTTGRQKALQLAEENNVKIDYHISTAEEFLCDKDFDAVGIVFLHLQPDLRTDFHRKLIDCLNPGGIIFMEVFEKRQIKKSTGGPKNTDMLYSIEELKHDLQTLDIKSINETAVHLREGPYHNGEAHVIRLVAKKPESQ